MGFHHVAVATRNVTATHAFYTEAMGFDLVKVEAAATRYGDDPPLPEFWGGYVVTPVEIELWEGRPNRLHDRLRYRRVDDEWVRERLAP